MVEWWWLLIVGILCIIAGLIAGFFITRKVFTNQLKKKPPVNASMIRAMYSRMGRKPSEAQVQSVISAMKKHQR